MITMGKEYKTKDGCEVRIYAADGGGPYGVHGAFKADGTWFSDTWTLGGSYNLDGINSLRDLVEKKKTFKIERWVNIFSNGTSSSIFSSRCEAGMAHSHNPRVACVKVIIEGIEGEGLEEEA